MTHTELKRLKELCENAADIIDNQTGEILNLQAEVERWKYDYEQACKTVALMHKAAVGEVTGPRRGVIEDVEDIRIENARLRDALEFYAQEAHYDLGSLVVTKVDHANKTIWVGSPDPQIEWTDKVSDDKGKRAREALGGGDE